MKLFPSKQKAAVMTPKQIEILKSLVRRNPDGSLLDVHQLMELITPHGARGSMICSLRHLATHKLIAEGPLETRRKRRVRTYVITQLGMNIIRPGISHPAFQPNVVIP